MKAILRTACVTGIAVGCAGDDGGPTDNGNNGDVPLTARHGHAMVFDDARHQLLLFGGTGTEGASASGDRNSTWKWDGTRWTRIATTGPSPRYLPAITYDAQRQRVVLHGGQSGVFPNITVLSDTWEWDGTSWTQKANSGPSPRVHQSIAFDRARNRVVLYGGFSSATNQELHDIWEWDGTSWQQASVSGAANTIAVGVAYDEKTSALYLYSIPESGGVPSASRWNGTTLTAVAAAAPPCTPITRQLTALGSSPGGLFLYTHTCDPTGTVVAPQSWRWDGAVWASVAGTQPPFRITAALAYDRDRNRVVLYGGEVGTNTPDLADTWEFDGTAWARK